MCCAMDVMWFLMQDYRAAIRNGFDEGIIVIGHLFVIGAKESDSLVIAVSFGIIPCN